MELNDFWKGGRRGGGVGNYRFECKNSNEWILERILILSFDVWDYELNSLK